MLKVEFPDYCIMKRIHQAIMKVEAMNNNRKSRNGCIGCGLNNCFGNSRYERELSDGQEHSLNKWRKYISKQIALEERV